MTEQGHPIDVDLERILPILAREIYTTPFAFLRENIQNAFDAIRIQQHRDALKGISQEHRIDITLQDRHISISDTGIGMSKSDLETLFWSIGKSGKHTEEARSAGVVGTFGIGGMANFGICSRLEVISRTHGAKRAIRCWADRAKLSAKDECVFYSMGPTNSHRGTTVLGHLITPIATEAVTEYLTPIVQYLDVPVYVEERLLSQKSFPRVPRGHSDARWVCSHGSAKAHVRIRAMKNGKAQIQLDDLEWKEESVKTRAFFSTVRGVVCAYQHGFMLANVPVHSVFGLAGSIDCSDLRPTAGREAVTDESRTLVEDVVAAVEAGLARTIAEAPGLPERFAAFYRYLTQTGRWDLADQATVRVYGSARRVELRTLGDSKADHVFFARDDHDHSLRQAYREQGKVVVTLSEDGYRKAVERNYLSRHCNAKSLEDSVTCLRVVDDLGMAESIVKYRLHEKLRRQYLLEDLTLSSGELTHGAFTWVAPKAGSKNIAVFVDFRHDLVKRLVKLRESSSFEAMADMFIRDYILPQLEGAFPDLRRRDFDALLKKLQSSMEFFEIDPDDVRRIQQLASTTNMSPETVAAILGGRRPRQPVTTSVRRADVAKVTDVLRQQSRKRPDEMREEIYLTLLEMQCDAKLLDASDASPELGLCPYYLALTKDAHLFYRRIFLERSPSADLSWGGYRAGYLFYTEGTAVVYYDIQFENLLQLPGKERSGTVTLDLEQAFFPRF
jgi:molecular chaperone HtpG